MKRPPNNAPSIVTIDIPVDVTFERLSTDPRHPGEPIYLLRSQAQFPVSRNWLMDVTVYESTITTLFGSPCLPSVPVTIGDLNMTEAQALGFWRQWNGSDTNPVEAALADLIHPELVKRSIL